MQTMSGLKIGDRVRATGTERGSIDAVIVQISPYKGFLIADLEGKISPQWCSLTQLHKLD